MFSPCKRFYILQLCHPFPPHHQFFSAQRRTSLVAFCNCVMFLATDHPCRVRRVVQQCRNLSVFHNFYAQSSNITIFTRDFHHEHVLRIVPCKSKCSHILFFHNFHAIAQSFDFTMYIQKYTCFVFCTNCKKCYELCFGVFLGNWDPHIHVLRESA